MFANYSMQYETDRDTSDSGQPALVNMTLFAIAALESQYREQGYFLLVEAGRIDHGNHANDGFRALTEAIELDRAVTAALGLIDTRETLVIVTADHGHTTFFGGYAARGNPILGKVRSVNGSGVPEPDDALAEDSKPYTALGYGAGPGGIYPPGERRPDLTAVDTEAKDFLQQASVPMGNGPHGGTDVALYAARQNRFT